MKELEEENCTRIPGAGVDYLEEEEQGGASRKRRRTREDGIEEGEQFQDWEASSTPMVAKGKEPKFIKPSEKFSATEGDNVFCFLEVQGDPLPVVTWFKVGG